jgi:hypothetical protein
LLPVSMKITLVIHPLQMIEIDKAHHIERDHRKKSIMKKIFFDRWQH